MEKSRVVVDEPTSAAAAIVTTKTPLPSEATTTISTEAAAAHQTETAATETTTMVTCVVCFDRFPPEHGVSCREGHFLCGAGAGGGGGASSTTTAETAAPASSCLAGHVHARGSSLRRVNRLASLAAEATAAGDTRRAQELGGAVFCPWPGCTAPHHTDADVVRHVVRGGGVTTVLLFYKYYEVELNHSLTRFTHRTQ